MPAIEQQGVVAAAATGRGTVARLVLSAPWRPVVARVAGLRARAGTSAPAARTVRVAAHRSVVVVLRGAGRGGSTFAVAVTPLPGSGPLYAGRVLAAPGKAGTVQSILPVASALTSVRLPQVRAALVTPGP
jgi:hypothetical protein